jgi:uncharacterized protein with FMN-binding domain
MTAKQKANELVDRYVEYVEAYSSQGQIENAKICALIAVDEITSIKLLWYQSDDEELRYWQEVKSEIKAIKS